MSELCSRTVRYRTLRETLSCTCGRRENVACIDLNRVDFAICGPTAASLRRQDVRYR